tara:strand:+ start:679 stop:852 length:174 start_codon:yes stop_codon:yes gene_type:complete
VKAGDLIRPLDPHWPTTFGLVFYDRQGELFVLWNDDPEPELLKQYDDDEVEVISEGR